MKRKTSTGTVLILSRPALRTRLHVPWPDNAAAFLLRGVAQGGSGSWYHFEEFALVGGDSFFYVTQKFATYAETQNYFEGYQKFTNPQGLTGYFGEWYNFVDRSNTFEKIPSADWSTWLGAH